MVKMEFRDPRFDSRCKGSSDRRHFIRNYAFLNDMRKDELSKLDKAFKKEKDPEKRSKIKSTMNMLRNKMVELDNQEKQMNTTSDMQSSSRRSSRGRFLKKSDIKKKLLVDKFQELKARGKLTKYLERKRKKNLKRDGKAFEQ